MRKGDARTSGNRKRKKINIHAKKMSFFADAKIQPVSNVLVRSVNLSNVFSVHNNGAQYYFLYESLYNL